MHTEIEALIFFLYIFTAIKVFSFLHIYKNSNSCIPGQNENVTCAADIRADISEMKQFILDMQKNINTISSKY